MANNQSSVTFNEIPINQILQPKGSIRKDFDLDPLFGSIKKFGLKDPITVTKAGKKFEVVDGVRRFMILKELKHKKIPAVIDNSGIDPNLTKMILNLHRKPLNPLEIARLFKKVQQAHGFTNNQLADWAHLSKSHVSGILKLNDLPKELHQEVRRAELPLATAIKVAQKPADQQAEALKEEIQKRKKTKPSKTLESEFGTDYFGKAKNRLVKNLEQKILGAKAPSNFKSAQKILHDLIEWSRDLVSLDLQIVSVFQRIYPEAVKLQKKEKVPKSKADLPDKDSLMF